MKQYLAMLLVFINVNLYAQTQAEMNQEAAASYQQSDQKLNDIYQNILSLYKTDTLFLANLKSSQRLWITFRDAEVAMKYPEYADNHYGSMLPICKALYLQQLTDARIETLNTWVGGAEEGDACIGSVKQLPYISEDVMNKATVSQDGAIHITASMTKEHRIFGYEAKDISSEKRMLLSAFTNEVENNPFNCKYGSYYDTSGLKGFNLIYINTEDTFIKVAIQRNGTTIDHMYMLKTWFELD